ncbi:HEPN domain-containing protein [Kocuria indica]|uniref:HEPN domain-containing protein n=1 Tax=Kocuria marina subsp. indica TaxID=1049583 RepID=A0A6N9R2P9_9MICC|nr:HEPN domain-containing protein [Kocuria indica]NDO79187.1 HEPN domain-containing protein [Kocuria indica]
MPAEDGDLKVLLNRDAEIVAMTIASRDLKAGEQVYLNDIQHIQEIHPINIDPNSGWICYVHIGAHELVTFDLRPNKAKASALLQKAREYLETARTIAKTFPDVSLDHAHSTAELSVQAQMLLLRNQTNNHRVRRKWFAGWTDLENSPRHHSDLLFDLANQRTAARYGTEKVALKPGRLAEILNTVQEMIDIATDRTT